MTTILNAMLAAAAEQPSMLPTILMFVALGAVMYFFMIRPQQKRQKEVQQKREALTTGDRIVTSGGLFGVIRDIKEKEFVVEIADGVRVRVDKGSVYPAADDQGQR